MKRYLFIVLLVSFNLLNIVYSQSNKQNLAKDESQLSDAFPVKLFNDTLFYIDTKLGTLTAEERAKYISARIERVFDDNDSIQIILSQNENTVDLMCGENFIMTVHEHDTISKNMSVEQLAENYKLLIVSSFVKAKKDRSLLTILVRIGLVLLVLSAIWLMIYLLRLGHRYLESKVITNKDKWLRNLSYKDYTFITANQELKVALWFLNILKWAAIIILIYLLLPLIFSIFPFSRGWATALFDVIWGPFKKIITSVWHYLPNLFAIIVIYFVFKYLIRFIRYIFNEIEVGKLKISGFHRDWAVPTFSIVRFLLYAFMFVLIFPYLPGSDSRVFQGVSVFLGLLVSLGSSSAISNMVAGLVITYMRPFKIGDRIKIGDVVGNVVEKTMLVTRLRTSNNENITIPNSAILSGNTTNYSSLAQTEGLILSAMVTISYNVPWRNVHEALLEAAKRTEQLNKEKKHFVLQTALNDFNVEYQLNVYTNETNAFAPIYNDVYQNIQDVCAERGIEIMSPHYLVQRDGHLSTMSINEISDNPPSK